VRIGLLGGSFDPPHNGHLLAAGDALTALRLDRVIFIPTSIQPLKAGRAGASAAQRLEMVRLLLDNEAGFELDSIEIDRGGLSYTVETLTALAAKMPGSELFWLVGADIPQTFAKWRSPERIVELATLVVLQRSDEVPELSGLPGAPQLLATRRVDISSTEIRQRVREGKSIRGFVPDSVAAFIASEALYQ
jgi:nicotinate-nucleotide adenylyltransferase